MATPQEREILIAVMGPTGTGKSTFVNKACGTMFAPVGDNLISRTADVAYSPPFELDGRKVILIDTPGFDDTVMSDISVLHKIALSLSITYKAGTKLSGIIFTHRISDNRMGGTMRKNFRMFQRLVGEDTFHNVVVVTNFWQEVEKAVGEARERELLSDERLYKSIVSNGSTMVRHDNTQQSAWAILRRIVDNYPMPLRIQKELIEENKPLELTDAAVELDKERAAKVKQHLAEMKEVKQKMEEAITAKDEEMKGIMEEWKDQLDEKMEELQNEKDRAAKMSTKHASDFSKMEASLKDYTAKKEESDKKVKALEKQLTKNQTDSENDKKVLSQQIKALQDQRDSDSSGGFWGGFFAVVGTVVTAAAIILL